MDESYVSGRASARAMKPSARTKVHGRSSVWYKNTPVVRGEALFFRSGVVRGQEDSFEIKALFFRCYPEID